jgi:hypothetical protein
MKKKKRFIAMVEDFICAYRANLIDVEMFRDDMYRNLNSVYNMNSYKDACCMIEDLGKNMQ